MSTNQSNQSWLGIFWLFQNIWRIRRSCNYKSYSKLHLLSRQIFWDFFATPSYFSRRIQFWVFIFILEKIWQRAHLSVAVFPPPGPACRRPLATWWHASLQPAPLTGLKPWARHAAVLPHLTAGMRLCLSARPRRLSTDRRAPPTIELQHRERAPPKPAIYPTVAAPHSRRVHNAGVARPVHRWSSRSSTPRVIESKPSNVVVAVYPGQNRRSREAVEPPPFPVPLRQLVRSLAIFSSM
jgi:hypothetical protein